MKITISGFYDEISSSLDRQIEAIKGYGERYLCPRVIDGKHIADYTADQFEKTVKPRLLKNGIRFSSIGSPIGKVAVDDDVSYRKQLDQLAELVAIARSMDCRYIRIFSFFMPEGENPAVYRDVVMRKMRGFLDVAKDSGVMLLHENEKKIYGDTPERCLDLYKTLGDCNFALIYDASNYIQCGVDAWEAYEMVKDYVVYYHVKDCDRLTGVEVPLGTGDGYYERLFDDLAARNFEGFATLEPHTAKYAKYRKLLYFVPFAAFFRKEWFGAFRRTDRKLGYSPFRSITVKDVFDLQYAALRDYLKRAENERGF